MYTLIVLEVWTIIAGWLSTYGLFGVFVISFFGSLIVFVPAPYFIPVAIVSQVIDPTMVALASAGGATAAKTIILRASYYVQNFLDEKTRARIKPFEKLVARYGGIATFIAASTPIPDDIVFIHLGFARYPLWKFVPLTLFGKFLLALFVAWGSRLSSPYIVFFMEGSVDPVLSIVTTAGLGVAVAIGIYVTTRVDWGPLITRWFPSLMVDGNDEEFRSKRT